MQNGEDEKIRWYDHVSWLGVSLLICFVLSARLEHGNALMLIGWAVGVIGTMVDTVMVASFKRRQNN